MVQFDVEVAARRRVPSLVHLAVVKGRDPTLGAAGRGSTKHACGAGGDRFIGYIRPSRTHNFCHPRTRLATHVAAPLIHTVTVVMKGGAPFIRRGVVNKAFDHASAWSYGALDPPRGSSDTNITPFIV